MRQSKILFLKNVRLNIKDNTYFQEIISPGLQLIYNRPIIDTSGMWSVCWVNPITRKEITENIGFADDFREADGKTVLTYVQAKNMAAEWLEQQIKQIFNIEEDDSGQNSSFTVADALHAYFKGGERRGMKGVVRDRMSADAWIVPRLGILKVSSLTRSQIEGWLDDIATTPRRVRTRAGDRSAFASPPATDDEKRARKDSANRVLTILKAALNFAVERGLVDASDLAWQKVRPFKGTSKARGRYLSPAEQVKLIEACPPDFRNLVRGALLTGCRYSELARLQCKDYASSDEIPTIFIAQSKSGKPRHIVLTVEGATLFSELTANASSSTDLIFANAIKRRKRTGSDSHGWLESDQKRYIKMACIAAGLEPISFHELRHTYATMLVNNRCPLPVVAQQLGHSDSRMVEKHYGHLFPSYVSEMVRSAMPVLGIVEPAKPTKVSGTTCEDA